MEGECGDHMRTNKLFIIKKVVKDSFNIQHSLMTWRHFSSQLLPRWNICSFQLNESPSFSLESCCIKWQDNINMSYADFCRSLALIPEGLSYSDI